MSLNAIKSWSKTRLLITKMKRKENNERIGEFKSEIKLSLLFTTSKNILYILFFIQLNFYKVCVFVS